jgi:hypothetical protein
MGPPTKAIPIHFALDRCPPLGRTFLSGGRGFVGASTAGGLDIECVISITHRDEKIIHLPMA